ncbi:beta galactosidase jelly roll domain-containing protein [Paenibacillus sp. J5C_2022]|uniref:beta-mannosidase n=1 Tax=Paenibacillus sp. J5C2022 TaxID=2977129 RepID=UPI0021D2FE35|nr:sugar-binding domain-containing protein [Paenibacillus sp. J5C2022]MCU6707359.1 beta galactosidase jelly roll domain-containing protein [Paenibacillus sp. J5C2022]
MRLHENWKIQSFDVGQMRDLEVAGPGFSHHFWIPAQVPGDVHSALIDNQIIEHPFFGHNDMKCRWVEQKVWWYKTDFQFDEEVERDEWVELVFEGLDTYATVYLNGMELGKADNMFLSYTYDVTRELRRGKNTLAVKFDPVQQHVQGKDCSHWAGFNSERTWMRKAQMNFGWDWGPRLVTVGIWKDVRLTKRNHAKIANVFARTNQLKAGQATVQIDIEVDSPYVTEPMEAEALLQRGDQCYYVRGRIEEPAGSLQLQVDRPALWWTHDLGEPNLYELHVKLLRHGEVLDEYHTSFGIRTVEVSCRDENEQPEFAFILNGVKLFAKGVNWIPVDSFFASASDSTYTHLIDLSKSANMNMIRVWGGGIYERDIFYAYCDQQGLLVWQDFMFACALYPDYNRDFMASVREEVTQTVKRLRNHPSIAIWCGNNENDWIYEKRYSTGEIKTPFYGEKIYHQLMPKLMHSLDSSRFYWPSSPFGGNDHNSAEEGDRHNWQVWHGYLEPRRFGEIPVIDYSINGVSFKNYKKDMTLFSSEFGMHAAANRHTLESSMPADKFYWLSNEMAYRNKDAHQPKGILLMEGYTGIPNDIDEYVDFSMLTQAEGLKTAVEHYRRRKPRTSGALIWQLNDCWPGTSWSMIDYSLLPKASYYYARKFFHPLLLTMNCEPNRDLELFVVNDTLELFRDELELRLYDFHGRLLASQLWTAAVKANSSERIALIERAWIGDAAPDEIVLQLSSKSGLAESNMYYLCDQKDLRLPEAKLEVAIDEARGAITITTDKLARFVNIQIPCRHAVPEDNFFDMMPNTSRTIPIRHLDGGRIPYSKLKVKALNSRSTSYSPVRCE